MTDTPREDKPRSLLEDIKALRELSKPTISQAEAETYQKWAGMDGAVAFHLIERHAANWADTRLMMDAWLQANAPRSSCPPRNTYLACATCRFPITKANVELCSSGEACPHKWGGKLTLPECATPILTPLSPEASAARKPLPPEVLASALQNPIDTGKGATRPATAIRPAAPAEGPTPRTDAIVSDNGLTSYQFKRDMIALARQLERELAAANSMEGRACRTDGCDNLAKLCDGHAERSSSAGPNTYEALYMELIMAVMKKFPNETRHQTALRYIMQRESGSGTAGSATTERNGG